MHRPVTPCGYRGQPTGEVRDCIACGGRKAVSIYACDVHGRCSLDRLVYRDGGRSVVVPWCRTCTDRVEPPVREIVPGLIDPIQDPEIIPPPKPDWGKSPEIVASRILAFGKMLATPMPPPTRCEGTGIVICGGGKFWPMIELSLRMARRVTDLPIQVWYRGIHEPVIPEEIADLPNIELVDASRFVTRIHRGWESKAAALVYTRFERVFFLDADAYLVGDPRKLLDRLTPERPFVFWTNAPGAGFNPAAFGLAENTLQTSVQGGQYALSRRYFWRELVLWHWLNQHSDWAYQHAYGDQDLWPIVLSATGTKYTLLGRPQWMHPAYICRVGKDPIVVHRCQGKLWGTGTDTVTTHLPGDDTVFRLLNRERPTVDIFRRIYRLGLWGHPESPGVGSEGKAAEQYAAIANKAIADLGAATVVDLGCGDGRLTRSLVAPRVIGVDCYTDHLLRLRREGGEWVDADLVADRDRLPAGDVAILKDVLHHWPNDQVAEWLRWAIAHGPWRHLMITNDYRQEPGADCPIGGYRGLSRQHYPLAGFNFTLLGRFAGKEVLRLDLYRGES